MDPSMASWDLRRDEQSVRTNRNTTTQVDPFYSLPVTVIS
jgi:hypothetical protein